jgi:hypothetical protein
MRDSVVDEAARWAEEVSTSLPPQARALSREERALAKASGVQQPDDIRIIIVDHVPFPDDPTLAALCERYGFLGDTTLGLTLGHAIFLTPPVADNAEIIAHECCHVAQVERLGSIRAFTEQYIAELMEYGYTFAPLELEATRTGQRVAGQRGAPWR